MQKFRWHCLLSTWYGIEKYVSITKITKYFYINNLKNDDRLCVLLEDL